MHTHTHTHTASDLDWRYARAPFIDVQPVNHARAQKELFGRASVPAAVAERSVSMRTRVSHVNNKTKTQK